jgi:hypothetical protein
MDKIATSETKTTVQQNPILEKVSVLHLSLEILQNIDIFLMRI